MRHLYEQIKIVSRLFLIFLFFTSFALADVPGDHYRESTGRVLSTDASRSTGEHIQRLATTIEQIKQYYVDNIDDERLFNQAIIGMLASLDPHSRFLDETALSALYAQTQGQFGGIGLEIQEKNNQFIVISPLAGSPSARAGIKPGDIILSINQRSVDELTRDQVIQLLRGKQGSTVTLTLLHADKKNTVKIVRDTIELSMVKSEVINKKYGYIYVSQFQATSAKQIAQTVNELKIKHQTLIKGWILDLRNNPGGLLKSGVAVSDLFLDKNILKHEPFIVSTKGRAPGTNYRAFATQGDILHGAPLIVLINGQSASAAEIVAGALQDHDRAIIAGQRTFGKGSVQTVLPIDPVSGIKLTTSLYYTPLGHTIQGKGIEPDILVEIVPTELGKQTDPLQDSKKITQDPIIKNALNLLETMSSLQSQMIKSI